ncbi:hypothetical protein [Pelosinus sp. sgz500959]|uniref:hypothetical protein n=1 Tax=Pelosinus sp. sgz500959 TaxID=3242472 RepID=UPI00366B3569
MNKNTCPRCTTELIDIPLYKCVRCFSVYCRACGDTSEGRFCPQCRMSQRMIISPDKIK